MIIWIASYPKSGNTWIRSLLSSYLFSESGKFSFELLKNIERFSVKIHKSNLREKSNYQTEISKNWIPSQIKINRDKKIRFLKTHNAMCAINGNKFTDKQNTLATIYIIRDPRNLVTSLAHHYQLNISDAFNFLTNKRKIIFPIDLKNNDNQKLKPEDFNFIGDWSSHYYSWKNVNFCPVKIVKYEDLINNTEESFISILKFLSNFLQINIDKKKIKISIDSTSFKNLSLLEKKHGFEESPVSSQSQKKIKFFNLGKKNDWKTLLDKNLIEKIESSYKNEMSELGYL